MSAAKPLPTEYRPCVGLMILNVHGQVWIGRRAGQEKLKGGDEVGEVPPMWWQMPQGGIDTGESPLQAAYRELHEETGILASAVDVIAESSDWLTYDLPPQLIGRVWKGRYKGQKQRWFAMRFHGDDALVNITPDDPDMIEFDAWRWADVDELLDLVIPFKKDVYVRVLAEMRHLAKPLA